MEVGPLEGPSLMAQAEAIEARYGQTHRTDRWWLEPLVTGSGLLLFVIYSSVVGVLGEVWSFEAISTHPTTGEETGIYISPFFEPLLHPSWTPEWVSPAIFILWAPIGFRTTCYYYRRTYYRAYFLSPPACAVKEPASSYSGESGFPLILQNAHRWFMYVALLFIPILWVGAVKSFHVPGEGFGIGVGSLVLTANAFLLMMYTIGCHSLRHWVAGGLNQFSRSPLRRLRRRGWEVFTVANEHHRLWAWTSLIWVGVTDLYIRLVAGDLLTDINTWSNF